MPLNDNEFDELLNDIEGNRDKFEGDEGVAYGASMDIEKSRNELAALLKLHESNMIEFKKTGKTVNGYDRFEVRFDNNRPELRKALYDSVHDTGVTNVKTDSLS